MDGTTASQLSTGEMAFNILIFVLGLGISAALGYFLLTEPARLMDAWEWVRSLHIIWQGVVWLLFAPWMIVLWIWAMPWAAPVQLVLMMTTLLGTNWLLYPWKG